MSDFLALLSRLQDWRNLLDIGLVALVIYAVLRLLRGTQAAQVLRGLVLIALAVAVINQMVELTAFKWLLSNTGAFLLVAIPVIFQPELRRALERLGRTTPLLRRRGEIADSQQVINEVVRAVEEMVEKRRGALIVFEGLTGLAEIINGGAPIDGAISSELITTIFFPNTALHDGAIIVRGDRLVAASCVLPLTQRDNIDPQLGTRHRAAIGMSEQSDALVVVVSEETGAVSAARNGRILRVDSQRLRTILSDFFNK